jgi:hypothetical protein
LSANDVAIYVGLGTVIGSLIGIFISSLLGRAQAISTFRQDWINSLRDVFSDVLLQAEVFTDVACQNNEEAYREKVELLKAIYKAKVFLNLKEEPSQKLIRQIEALPDEYMGKAGGSKEFKSNRHEIEALMRTILKEEWDRVRDGEFKWNIKKHLNKKFKAEPLSYNDLMILSVILGCIVVAIFGVVVFNWLW